MKAGSSLGNPVEVPRLAWAASVVWDSPSTEVMTLLCYRGKQMLILVEYIFLFFYFLAIH